MTVDIKNQGDDEHENTKQIKDWWISVECQGSRKFMKNQTKSTQKKNTLSAVMKEFKINMDFILIIRLRIYRNELVG